MPPENPFTLPFLNRDMLRFGQTTKFEIRVVSQADTAATLSIRGITREGQFTFKHTTQTTAAAYGTGTFGVPDIPIMISVSDDAQALEQGQAFVVIQLLANGEVIQQLTSGYVYAQKGISWPQTQAADLRPQGGRLQVISITDPAAGSIAEATVPVGEIWVVRSVSFTLVTNATVATRRAYLEVDDGQGGFYSTPAEQTQAASLTRAYSFAPAGYGSPTTVSVDVSAPLPSGIIIPANGFLDIKVENIQAGDNINAPAMTVEKFFAKI